MYGKVVQIEFYFSGTMVKFSEIIGCCPETTKEEVIKRAKMLLKDVVNHASFEVL